MSAFSSSSASSGTLAVKPCSACAIDEVRARLRVAELRELAPVDALELRVEAAPAGDAVDVGRDLGGGQLAELVEAERRRLLDLAGQLERPRGDVDVAAPRPRGGRATSR